MSDQPQPPSPASNDKAQAFDAPENRFHVRLHLMSVLVGTVLALVITLVIENRTEARHKRILIPILIEGADRQGGQFALGVSRAMEFAHRYRLDQIDDHRVDPWLLDERIGVDQIVALIAKEEPPIVIGPLRSSPAIELVPRLARPRAAENAAIADTTTVSDAKRIRGLGIPTILGIPTNTSITRNSDLVWRLSPTDDVQANLIAKVYQASARTGAPAVIVQDLRPRANGGNPGYVTPLKEAIVTAVEKLKLTGYPVLEEVAVTVERGTNDVQSFFEKRQPRTVIYLGMPDTALAVLRKAQDADINATWIFTDSCITSPQALIPLFRTLQGEFFITFQAAPASISQGLQLYMFYTRSTGGNVLFALDPDNPRPQAQDSKESQSSETDVSESGPKPKASERAKHSKPCDRYQAAPTYEVFGFDSYLTALLVLRDAHGERSGVVKRFNNRKIDDPLLIGESYEFDEYGDSKNTQFYLYEFVGDCTSYISLEALAERHSRKGSR